MKKILFAIVLASLVFVSCEKTIEFNGRETARKVVLYSQAVAGEPLTARISTSMFFLDVDMRKYTSLLDTENGSVKVYVNDSETPYEMQYFPVNLEHEWEIAYSLEYVCDYVPSCGDRIRIEASFPGFDAVEGETVVPYVPDFKILSIKETHTEDGYVQYDISARLTDDASYSKYYCLMPCSRITSEDYSFVSTFGFTSNDVIFQNTDPDLESVISGESGTSSYFPDSMISGKSHDFNFSFRYYEGPGGEEKVDNLMVMVQTLTDSNYYHLLSMSRITNDFGLFSEGITLYSNVKGGYGCVCSVVSLYLQIK